MGKNGIFAACALALLGVALLGCNPEATPQVSVVRVQLQDWTNPDDGQTYLIAVPTWEVKGNLPVAEVRATAMLTGQSGRWDLPERESPLYRGDALDPGTTFNPTNIPEDALVFGLKKEVLAKTGANPKVEVFLYGSSEQTDSGHSDPPPSV